MVGVGGDRPVHRDLRLAALQREGRRITGQLRVPRVHLLRCGRRRGERDPERAARAELVGGSRWRHGVNRSRSCVERDRPGRGGAAARGRRRRDQRRGVDRKPRRDDDVPVVGRGGRSWSVAESNRVRPAGARADGDRRDRGAVTVLRRRACRPREERQHERRRGGQDMCSGLAAHDETKAIRKASAKHSPSAHKATNRSCSPRPSTAAATRAGNARAGTTARAAVASRNRNPPARRNSKPAGRCSSSLVARAATGAAAAEASRGRSRSGAGCFATGRFATGRFATGRLCEVATRVPGCGLCVRMRCTRACGGALERAGGGGAGGGTALAAGGGGGGGNGPAAVAAEAAACAASSSDTDPASGASSSRGPRSSPWRAHKPLRTPRAQSPPGASSDASSLPPSGR